MIAIIIGIDHGYYAIKTRQVSFPSGIIRYDYEPYTMQNVLQYQGKYYVCGTGRQTLVKDVYKRQLMKKMKVRIVKVNLIYTMAFKEK